MEKVRRVMNEVYSTGGNRHPPPLPLGSNRMMTVSKKPSTAIATGNLSRHPQYSTLEIKSVQDRLDEHHRRIISDAERALMQSNGDNTGTDMENTARNNNTSIEGAAVALNGSIDTNQAFKHQSVMLIQQNRVKTPGNFMKFGFNKLDKEDIEETKQKQYLL